jgi:predicted phage baseplate assembly protein
VLAPPIDPRKFQDLVDEAKRRIPLYCPEWTDHNVSDPGVMLIELFAWMVDILLYRVNQMPDRAFLRFLELIGAHPRPALPASAELTFWLTAPSTGTRVIPHGIEIATRQTEAEPAVIFTTDADLRILEPRLDYFVLARRVDNPDGSQYDYEDISPRLKRDEPTRAEVFQAIPREGDGFYVGFAENMGGHVVRLTVQCDRLRASNINQDDPPLVWEFWDGDAWRSLLPPQEDVALLRHLEPECEELGQRFDETRGLNRDGRILLIVPRTCARSELELADRTLTACWIRCTARRDRADERFYDRSPVIQGVRAESLGALTTASQAFDIVGEVLGRSAGTPGQSFRLLHPPILPRQHDEEAPERVELVQPGGAVEPWTEVETFADSTPTDSHYVIDDLTGEVQFGPRLRAASGEERQFGRIPPKGQVVRVSRYRSGGGTIGNVGRDTLVVPKSASELPYVKWVANLRAATGGRDAETLDEFRLRGPQLVRTREVAVTRSDFEFHALEATPRVGRVHCVAVRNDARRNGLANGAPPGQVRLLIVPAVSTLDELLTPTDLRVSEQLRRTVRSYLRERCPLTTEVTVGEPDYCWVSVRARLVVRPQPGLEEAARQNRRLAIAEEAQRRLNAFIHPVTGGEDGKGWEWGAALTLGDIYPLLQRLPDVEYVDEARFRTVTFDEEDEPRFGVDQRLVRLEESELLCSFTHELIVDEEEPVLDHRPRRHA